MSTKACYFCGQPRAPRHRLVEQGDGRLYCRACMEDVKAGRPVGSTAALRSFAVKTVVCKHCGAARGVLCAGPGVVRFIHARRRDSAAELQRSLREDLAHGN